MSNWSYSRKKVSERVELSDVLRNKKIMYKLSKEELEELADYLKWKKLLVYDRELDFFKEEK
jgi:hypothetical protein